MQPQNFRSCNQSRYGYRPLEMDIVDVKELNDPVVKIIMRNLGKDYENVLTDF
jgi:hypothetical protein